MTKFHNNSIKKLLLSYKFVQDSITFSLTFFYFDKTRYFSDNPYLFEKTEHFTKDEIKFVGIFFVVFYFWELLLKCV